MPGKIRRIVTGHNDQAEVVVKIDEVIDSEPIRSDAALFTKVGITNASPPTTTTTTMALPARPGWYATAARSCIFSI